MDNARLLLDAAANATGLRNAFLGVCFVDLLTFLVVYMYIVYNYIYIYIYVCRVRFGQVFFFFLISVED